MEQFRENERDTPGYESVHTGSEEETGSGATQRRTRQQSVPEMMKARQHQQPRASKRQRQASGKTNVGSEITLDAIEALIQAGNAKIIGTIENKFSSLERRLEILESELFDKNAKIERLEKEMQELQQKNAKLVEQVEGIDTNRRLNTLIFFSKDFGEPKRTEDIEDKLVQVLNRHMPEVEISKEDFQTVHRLYGDNKVIAKFMKTDKRNKIYQQRFVMAKRRVEERPENPLYTSESLSEGRKEIFNIMLEAKRCEVVHSVFTRRGIVHIKSNRDALPQAIDDVEKAREILRNGPRRGSGQRSEPRDRGDRRPLPAPSVTSRGRGRSVRGGDRGGAGGGSQGRDDERRPDQVLAPVEDGAAAAAERPVINREDRDDRGLAQGSGDAGSGTTGGDDDLRGGASPTAGGGQRGDS